MRPSAFFFVSCVALSLAQAPRATPVTDSLTHYYAQHDVAGVRRLLGRATTREERLLVLYRLFPLTLDDAWLADLPSERGMTSAREMALLAALWAYRAKNAPAWRLPFFGRRSEGILRRAQRIDPAEPYVLLVDGQSRYYKPAVFGGDAAAAYRQFVRLRDRLRGRTVPGLHPLEAEVWMWMSLRRLGHADAEPLRQRLLARRPPPLFRQFLLSPP
ncbi:MAG TPA: hypothetical protein VD962_06695 [Rubricoccaceae bacterium]|nr:hypothetical protein [Rubricoccaceae bacterium]